jgi:hypothetical protein
MAAAYSDRKGDGSSSVRPWIKVMRRRGVILVFVGVVGCGGRTMLDDDLGGSQLLVSPATDAGTGHEDAAVDAVPDLLVLSFPDVAPPSPDALPPYVGGGCFGSVTSTSNVTCSQSVGGTADNCNGEITCNGNQLLMECQDGVCTCLNPAFGDTCYCTPPPGSECSASLNCCWR